MTHRRGEPTRAKVLTLNGVSNRLGAAGFTRHRRGTAGYSVEHTTSGTVEVWHLDAHSEVLNAGPEMGEWGRYLKRSGFAVRVCQGTHLLVTLPDGAAAGAPRAVERAA